MKEEEVWIPSSGARFVITGMECLQQCSHNNFASVASGRDPGFFIIVTGREVRSLSACPESHAFGHYPPVMRKKQVKTLCAEEEIFPSLSAFVGHENLHHKSGAWTKCHRLR